jgi:hypothetical protein
MQALHQRENCWVHEWRAQLRSYEALFRLPKALGYWRATRATSFTDGSLRLAVVVPSRPAAASACVSSAGLGFR